MEHLEYGPVAETARSAPHNRLRDDLLAMIASWRRTASPLRTSRPHDVTEVIAVIEHFIAGYNQHAQPFA